MKTVICNNCVGARLYQQLEERFNNPFMWNLFRARDYFNLVRDFDQIDFGDIQVKVVQNSPMNKNTNVVSVVLNGKIEVPFVHHHVDESKLEITKSGTDMYYSEMERYVKERFAERSQRITGDIVFLLVSPMKRALLEFSQIKTSHEKVFVGPVQLDGQDSDVKVILDTLGGGTGNIAKRILQTNRDLFV